MQSIREKLRKKKRVNGSYTKQIFILLFCTLFAFLVPATCELLNKVYTTEQFLCSDFSIILTFQLFLLVTRKSKVHQMKCINAGSVQCIEKMTASGNIKWERYNLICARAQVHLN